MNDKNFTTVYALFFTIGDKRIYFYVGRSNDVTRREAEHRRAAKNLNETTDKYRWIRQLEASGIEWHLETVCLLVEDEADSEYEWVLRIARNNLHDGITFFDGLPLTNLRRGDFLEEMLRDTTVNTAAQVKQWLKQREEAAADTKAAMRRAVAYERKINSRWTAIDQSSAALNVATRVLRLLGIKQADVERTMRGARIAINSASLLDYIFDTLVPDESDLPEFMWADYLRLRDEWIDLTNTDDDSD
jgi:hypothetical protein